MLSIVTDSNDIFLSDWYEYYYGVDELIEKINICNLPLRVKLWFANLRDLLYWSTMQALDNRTLEFIAIYVTSSISLHHTTTPNTTPMMLFHT